MIKYYDEGDGRLSLVTGGKEPTVGVKYDKDK